VDKIHWKKAFNKEYLGAHDLDEGQELKVVIKSVEVKPVKDPQGAAKDCNIAHFTTNTKPMILNVTACKQLKRFTGSNYIEDWANTPIQIYAATIKAFGEVTDALRIRDQQPRTEKPELTPDSKQWPEAVKAMADPMKGLSAIERRYTITNENVGRLKNEAGL